MDFYEQDKLRINIASLKTRLREKQSALTMANALLAKGALPGSLGKAKSAELEQECSDIRNKIEQAQFELDSAQ